MKFPTMRPTISVLAAACPYQRVTPVLASLPIVFPSHPTMNMFVLGNCAFSKFGGKKYGTENKFDSAIATRQYQVQEKNQRSLLQHT
jgi:hypothetical protein